MNRPASAPTPRAEGGRRTVVVTGTSRGLGLCLAEGLLGAGYDVVGVSRTDSAAYRALCEAHPGRAHVALFDLADTGGIHALCRGLLERFGAPYGLVNNAATGGESILPTAHDGEIETTIAVNLLAPILLTKYLSRPMLARREGRVVNISSIAARTGFSGLSVYAATKAGLEGFSRALSRELGKRSITVNTVAPGFLATEMTAGLVGPALESVRRRAPLGLASPTDVLPAVLYLLGDGAARVTGTTVVVDGGSIA